MSVKFTDNSKEILSAFDDAVLRGLEAVGITAEGHAKNKTPVDTGRLRNSIAHAVAEDEKAAYIGTNVEYAPYVELGTRFMSARPYLRPAAEGHGEEYKRIMEAALKGTE